MICCYIAYTPCSLNQCFLIRMLQHRSAIWVLLRCSKHGIQFALVQRHALTWYRLTDYSTITTNDHLGYNAWFDAMVMADGNTSLWSRACPQYVGEDRSLPRFLHLPPFATMLELKCRVMISLGDCGIGKLSDTVCLGGSVVVDSDVMQDSVATEELCVDEEALMQWRDSNVMG